MKSSVVNSPTNPAGSGEPTQQRPVTSPGERRKSTQRDSEAARRAQRTIELLSRARDDQFSQAERNRCQELAIRINLPVADSLARRYRSRGEDLEDLTQVARLGLIQAARRFDPDTGAFLAFAIPTISGEIKRHFRDHCWTVRPPRRLQELHSEVATTWAELAQEQSTSPTAAEVADRIGADCADVLEAMRSNAFRSASLDASEGLSATADTLGGTDPAYDEVDETAERRDLIRRVDEACQRLSNDERRLLRLRFAQGRSQSAIATELEISQMSVSRRLRKVTQRLRADVTNRPNSRRTTSPVAESMRRRTNPVPRQPVRA